MKAKLSKLDRRQVVAYAVIILFMLVTVGHVANYAGSFEPGAWSILGWFYAIAVDGSIVVCAWMTTWKTTRKWATVGYFLSVFASGALNVAQVKPWDVDFGAWVYAIFPTIAQALLGFLARDAGKFTKVRSDDERVAQLRAELTQAKAALAQVGTMRRAKKTDFDEIRDRLNGSAPTDAQGVNDLLNDEGYYSKSDSTARNWARDDGG